MFEEMDFDSEAEEIIQFIDQYKEYVSKDVAKAINTSENKIAINFGTELHIISKNGILLKKYISEVEMNDIVMVEGIIGIVYKDKIQIINL